MYFDMKGQILPDALQNLQDTHTHTKTQWPLLDLPSELALSSVSRCVGGKKRRRCTAQGPITITPVMGQMKGPESHFTGQGVGTALMSREKARGGEEGRG